MSDSLLNFDSPFYLIFYWPGIFFVSAVLIGLVFVYLRSRRWRRGRDTPHHGGLRKIPRRYLVDVHDVVARDRQAAIMHVPAAGGFILALVLIVVVHVLGIATNLSRYFLLAALAVHDCWYALLVLYRRLPNRSATSYRAAAWNLLPCRVTRRLRCFYAAVNVATHLPFQDCRIPDHLVLLGICVSRYGCCFELNRLRRLWPDAPRDRRFPASGLASLVRTASSDDTPDAALKPLDLADEHSAGCRSRSRTLRGTSCWVSTPAFPVVAARRRVRPLPPVSH